MGLCSFYDLEAGLQKSFWRQKRFSANKNFNFWRKMLQY